MTKKHFQMIADTIKFLSNVTEAQREEIARDFARSLCSTNPNFDSERFVAACVGETPKRKAKPVGTKSLERLLKF